MARDQPQICMNPKQVSFMWSYPNYIPLGATAIRHVLRCLEALEFDRIYGAFFVRGKGIIPSGGKQVVRRSAGRYLKAIHKSRLPFASRPIAGTIPPGAGSCR